MPHIKFSHNYCKTWEQTRGRLLDVVLLDAKTLNDDLVEYDTKYFPATLADSCGCELHTNFPGDEEHCHYPLPKGELIQLIFVGDKGIPFCTIRTRYRYDRGKNQKVDKCDYYSPLIGEWFDVVVKEHK